MLKAQYRRRFTAIAIILALFTSLLSLTSASAAADEDFFGALENTSVLATAQTEESNIEWPTFENPDNKPVKLQLDFSVNNLDIETPDFTTADMPEIIKQLGLRISGQADLVSHEIAAGLGLLSEGSPLLNALLFFDEENIMLAVPEISTMTFAAKIATLVEDFNSSAFAEAFATTLPEDFDIAASMAAFWEGIAAAESVTSMPDTTLSEEDLAAFVEAFEPMSEEILSYVEAFQQSWVIEQGGQEQLMYGDEEVTCDVYTAKIPGDAVIEYLKAVATRMYGGEEIKALAPELGMMIYELAKETGAVEEELDMEELQQAIDSTLETMLASMDEMYSQIVFADDILYTIKVAPDGIVISHVINMAVQEPLQPVIDPETDEIDEEATEALKDELEVAYIDIVCDTNGARLLDNINMTMTVTVEEESITATFVSTGNSVPDENGQVANAWEVAVTVEGETMSVYGSSSSNVKENSFSFDIGITVPESAEIAFGVSGSVQASETMYTLLLDSIRLVLSDESTMNTTNINMDLKAAISAEIMDGVDFPRETVISAFTDEGAVIEFQNATTELMNILMPILAPFMETGESLETGE